MKDKKFDSEKWGKEEISKTAKIIIEAESKKSFLLRLLDESIHWLIILIIILGHVIFSGFIVILSGLLTGSLFYVIIILLGMLFGYLIDNQLRDIEKINKEKHLLVRIMIVILAIVNIFILFGMKQAIEFFSGIVVGFNPLIAGCIYAISFLLPHFLISIKRKRVAAGTFKPSLKS